MKFKDYLREFVTEKRFNQFTKVLDNRTRHISVVLEDIYQAQNASAVLRSCDCFGIQDVHIIENRNRFNVHKAIAMGSSKWLTLNHYNKQENNTLDAINRLKADGYQIVATTPHTDDIDLEKFPITDKKIALVFGTELTGISDVVRDNADKFMKVPMYGFTESFNISVCAALTMHHLSNKMRESDINWKLQPEEREQLLEEWMRKSVKEVEKLERRFIKDNKI